MHLQSAGHQFTNHLSAGNLSGFTGPALMGYMSTHTGCFRPGLLLIAGSYALAALLVLSLRIGSRQPA